MSDIEGFNPANQIFCHMHVGRFFHNFNLLERQVDDAIGAALGVNELLSAILGVNIDMQRKIFILKTVLTATHLDNKQVRHYSRYVNKLTELNATRNHLAHHPFGPNEDDDSGGITIMFTQAQGEWRYDRKTLNENKMQSMFRTIDKCYGKLEELATLLRRRPKPSPAFLHEILKATSLDTLTRGYVDSPKPR